MQCKFPTAKSTIINEYQLNQAWVSFPISSTMYYLNHNPMRSISHLISSILTAIVCMYYYSILISCNSHVLMRFWDTYIFQDDGWYCLSWKSNILMISWECENYSWSCQILRVFPLSNTNDHSSKNISSW